MYFSIDSVETIRRNKIRVKAYTEMNGIKIKNPFLKLTFNKGILLWHITTETIGSTETTDAIGSTAMTDAIDLTQMIDAIDLTVMTEGLTETIDAIDSTAMTDGSTETTDAIDSTETVETFVAMTSDATGGKSNQV